MNELTLPGEPEELTFQLDYYGRLIALSLALYRVARATSLLIATVTGDETAYREYTGIVATYVCAIRRVDPRHVIWVEQEPTSPAGATTYTLVDFERTLVRGPWGLEIALDNPTRTPLPPEQFQMLLHRVTGEEGQDR
jgi:hypothetical protein